MTEEQKKEMLATLEEEWRKNYRKRRILLLKLSIVNKEITRIEKEIEKL